MVKKNLLITGGLGFIGSHTISLLKNSEYEIFVIDNYINCHKDVIDHLISIDAPAFHFFEIDLQNYDQVDQFFKHHRVDLIIHYAGLKSVFESIANPENYYRNNILSTLNLLRCLHKDFPVKFIFSSSATVYGNQKSPVTENMSLHGLNPYASTKVMNEHILKDFALNNSWFELVILRYFNPIGAHPSGLIGENPKGIPNNLMPYINKVACGELESLSIYGKDYDTPDGTCLRDFIHVLDLAEVHLLLLKHKLQDSPLVLNVGTGKPTSVKEMVEAYQQANKVKIPHQYVNRRQGDIDISYADNRQLVQLLDWKPKYNIEEMCKHALNYVKHAF